jgi:hypothetical protein
MRELNNPILFRDSIFSTGKLACADFTEPKIKLIGLIKTEVTQLLADQLGRDLTCAVIVV